MVDLDWRLRPSRPCWVYFIQTDAEGADYSGACPGRTNGLARPFTRPAGPKYVIVSRRPCDSMIKIGVAADIWQRLHFLYHYQTRQPMRLLTVIPGSYDEERALQKRFSSCAVDQDLAPARSREWFWPSDELLAFIRDHRPPSWVTQTKAERAFGIDDAHFRCALEREWAARSEQRRKAA